MQGVRGLGALGPEMVAEEALMRVMLMEMPGGAA
jgi:hypothetical protein